MRKDEFVLHHPVEDANDILNKIDGTLDNVVVDVGEIPKTSSSGSSLDDLETTALTPPQAKRINFEEHLSKNSDQLTRFTSLVNAVNQTVTPDVLHVVRLHLNNHPEKFQQFPTVVGSKMYPAPQALAEQIKDEGHEVPRFLTDISDAHHVPPHIVACELLNQNRHLRDEIEFLKKKLDSV